MRKRSLFTDGLGLTINVNTIKVRLLKNSNYYFVIDLIPGLHELDIRFSQETLPPSHFYISREGNQ